MELSGRAKLFRQIMNEFSGGMSLQRDWAVWFENYTPGPAIYGLFKDGDLIYIGQTSQNIFGRLGQHVATGKEFDGAFVWNVPKEVLLQVETALITIFQPELNKTNGKGRNDSNALSEAGGNKSLATEVET